MAGLRRRALLIGVEHYQDAHWTTLPSTRADVWYLSEVLKHPKIGSFEVEELLDPTTAEMQDALTEFLQARDGGELALVYISGHGTRSVPDRQFHFVTSDTAHNDIEETSVSAGFVNEQLEMSLAPQKIAVLDCCTSGGFAPRWDTKPGVAKSDPVPESPLGDGRGAHVLASSGALESSYAGGDGPEGPEPSVFTGEIIETLRTGSAAKGGQETVSVHDLFDRVVTTMRDGDHGQVPVAASLGVNDRIVVARSPYGPAPDLKPLTGQDAAARHRAGEEAKSGTGADTAGNSSAPAWQELLAYYQECLQAEASSHELPRVDNASEYRCLPGREQFLSGALDDEGCVSIGAELAPFVSSLGKDDEICVGYPVVVRHSQPHQRRQSRSPVFAPLLVRRVEVVQDGRLRPYGPVFPDPRLVAATFRSQSDVDALLETYEPTWQVGQYEELRRQVRYLLDYEYQVPCVEELDPEHLSPTIDDRSPGEGARNAAVLFRLPREASSPLTSLIKDLERVRERRELVDDISGTALGALLGDSCRMDAEREQFQLVTPFRTNESQRAIMTSAMTNRLTVATGPPGTGKSQLVANLVATAETNDEAVLVSSTNNRAVDEVWKRCEDVVSDSVVRTGSRGGAVDYQRAEADTLARLRKGRPSGKNEATAQAELTRSHQTVDRRRTEFAELAQEERDLALAGEERARSAAILGTQVADLSERIGGDERLARVERRAHRVAKAVLFGGWRQARFLRGLLPHATGDAASCRTVAEFASAERSWRRLRRIVEQRPEAADLLATIDESERELREHSTERLRAAVAAHARRGRQALEALASNSKTSDWPLVRKAVGYIRGWAVTTRSAKRFPPEPALFDLVIIDEASQCTIPDVLPLLFRARRAVVIGDVMQLPHISSLDARREMHIRGRNGLQHTWVDEQRLSYRRHSAFHAVERAGSRNGHRRYLLDEHYRCHPVIGGVANDLFYDGSLNVLTNVRDLRMASQESLRWHRVEGNAVRPVSGRSWRNDAEIQAVDEIVTTLLRELPSGADIGIVTPFKAQEVALRKRWEQASDRVQIGTVHTFQGGERDAIVFSLVAADGITESAAEWINDQIHLWNVAMTRARGHLVLVGDDQYWRRRGGTGAAVCAAVQDRELEDDGPVPQRLYDALDDVPEATVELNQRMGAYLVDAVVTLDGAPTAVLLDESAEDVDNGDAARGLRLTVRRCALLDPPAVRVPTWQLYDPAALASTLRLRSGSVRGS